MQSIQDNINEDQIKKRFTELRQELGSNKLKYDVDNLCEIYQELYKKGYIISGFIGNGGEGVVFEAVKKDNKSIVAVKCVFVVDKQIIEKEVEILKKLQNQPFIHQFLDGFYSTNNKFFFYITEKLHCDLKSVMDNLVSKKQQLPYNSIIAFMIQITTALNTLKSNNIFHFDVKPVNVFYDKVNKCFKLADYGMAKKVDITGNMNEFQSVFTTQLSGFDPKYISPEVRNGVGKYNNRTDVYSLGLILLELSRGVLLEFHEAKGIRENHESLLKYLSKNKQHYQLNGITKQMLIIDRSKRITPEDLLQKLESLQNEQESNLYTYLQTQVDDLTFQSIKQLYSSSLTQVNLDSIVADSSKRIFMRHHSLKFKDRIETAKQLAEVEEALAKYQNDSSVSLGVGLKLLGYTYPNDTELNTKLGASVVTSRLASGLEKSSASITSLSLEFSSLKIGHEGASSLATSIEKCSKNLLVVGLKFGGCNIGSDGIKYISQSLEECDKMTTLGLNLYNYNSDKVNIADIVNIGPTGVSYLASSLPKCKSLTELTLNLTKQSISNEGLQSLGSGLSKCEKLTRLNVLIYDESIGRQSIEEFGSSLARCPNLSALGVQFHGGLNMPIRQFDSKIQPITYAIALSLLPFAKLASLTLFLGGGNTWNISIPQITLNSCQNLTSLCLSMEHWTLDGASSLVESLEESNLTTLKLIFSWYKFSDQTQKKQEANRVGESLSRFKKLASLYLFFYDSHGNPTQFISTLLSNHLAQNKNITTLSLGVYSYCNSDELTSSDSKMIGESLEKCKYLQTLHLYLWGNEIKSKGALAVSQSLSKCVHLTALDLSIIESQMDSVSSTITNDLKKCKNLEELKVGIKSYVGEDDRNLEIKLGILTPFESNFFW